jgi:hypothetical protein
VVVSKIESHSAKEVCESESSAGPDFVSTVEGVFCDTAAKEWWYLCSSKISTGCFDLETQRMVGNANATGHHSTEPVYHNATSIHSREVDASTGRVVPVKLYKTSETWE